MPLHCNALSSCLINNAKKFHSVFSGLKQSHAKWLIAMISPLCIYLLPALALAEKANRYLAYPCNAFSCNLKQYTMQSCVVCTFHTETVQPNCLMYLPCPMAQLKDSNGNDLNINMNIRYINISLTILIIVRRLVDVLPYCNENQHR